MIFVRLATFAVAFTNVAGCAAHNAAEPAPGASPSPGTVKRPAVTVRLAPVVRRTLTGTISASGEVISGAGGQANLAFPTSGQIASVGVAIGDRVLRGEILARLDERVAQRDIAQAMADVETAQAQLAKAQAGARPQELAQNRALVTGADAKVRTAHAELQRQQSLATVGIASRRDLEQAQAAYADALAGLRDKEQAGSLLAAGPRFQDIDLARAQLAQSRAALATAQTRASLLTLVAPFDGVVTARMKGAGEVVDTSTSVLTLVDPAKALVSVRLSEDQAALVTTGDPAAITINAAAQSIRGEVSTINASLDSTTRTLQALITPVEGSTMRPGASASARITVRSVADAYVVPARALVKDPDSGQTLVFAPIAGGVYRRIAVETVLQSAGYAAIRSPRLSGVPRVVTDGAYELLPYAVGGESG